MNVSLFHFFALIVISTIVTALFATASGVPTINEQFSVRNHQYDDTLGGVLEVRQLIIQDPINRRSKMVADGPLVNGFLEQVVRCDGPISPAGYIIQLSGPNLKETNCVNETIRETWSDFWSFPANATYIGQEKPPGFSTAYECYMYWMDYEQWKVYVHKVRDDKSNQTDSYKYIPIWSGRIFTPYPAHHLYHMEWVDFIGGPAPVSAFTPLGNTTGCRAVGNNNNNQGLLHREEKNGVRGLSRHH